MDANVLEALRAMRPPFVLYEMDLHRLVGEQLDKCNLPYKHEAKLSPGCRIDFLIGDVGVEIKKGKPRAATLTKQLARYAASEAVHTLVVVSWRSVSLPATIGDKKVHLLSLSQLWGVSLP